MSESKTPQSKPHGPIRLPVKRARAETYLIISITVFAATVILTRIFLELTGYPQLGNSVLHFAHALWGGLLLIIAAYLPLILINDWALMVSSVLSGIGVGLFIDEVGKFITQSNDYFFPPAAPVIYAFFLILVLLALAVRKTRPELPRNELYRALGDLREIVDRDLDAEEWKTLDARLTSAQHSDQAHIVELAAALQAFLHSESVTILPVRPTAWHHLIGRIRSLGQKIGRRWHHRLIIAAMGLIVGGTVLSFTVLLLTADSKNTTVAQIISMFLTQDEIASANDGFWFYLRLGLDVIVSFLALITMILFVGNKDRAGVKTALFTLLIALTGGTLLAFYLDQFQAVVTALYGFLVLLMVLAYQRWYLDQPALMRDRDAEAK